MDKAAFILKYAQVNRKFEKLFYPKARKALRSKADDLVIKLKSGGTDYAERWLRADIANYQLTATVKKLHQVVGLRHARMNYSRLLADRGKKSMILKAFGFNEIWTRWIADFFRKYLIEKITYEVAETTRTALLAILTNATAQGWSTDQTIDAVEGWDERHQAARVVRTETTRAANAGAAAQAVTAEYQQLKEWISAHDHRVRGVAPKDHANHVTLDGVTVNEDDKFVDSRNGDRLDFPGDPAGSAASVINCRCSVAYTWKRDAQGNLIPKRKTTVVIYPGDLPKPETITV